MFSFELLKHTYLLFDLSAVLFFSEDLGVLKILFLLQFFWWVDVLPRKGYHILSTEPY